MRTITKSSAAALLLASAAAMTTLSRARVAAQASSSTPSASGPIDFARDIRPIFEAHCLACHGETRRKGGLRLDHKSFAMAGSSSGKVIEPGDSAKSALIERVLSADAD